MKYYIAKKGEMLHLFNNHRSLYTGLYDRLVNGAKSYNELSKIANLFGLNIAESTIHDTYQLYDKNNVLIAEL